MPVSEICEFVCFWWAQKDYRVWRLQQPLLNELEKVKLKLRLSAFVWKVDISDVQGPDLIGDIKKISKWTGINLRINSE